MINIITVIEGLPLKNIDLFMVGIAIASVVILGFVIYINNRKSITNKAFLLFSIVTALWSFFNYLNYQTKNPAAVLWLLKIVIFLGVWHSFSFFCFFYFYPSEEKKLPKWLIFLLLPFVTLVSLVTLTPLVFSGVSEISTSGAVSKVTVQPTIIIFIITVISLLTASVTIFVRKTIKLKKTDRKRNKLILLGTIVTFGLLFLFNLILPGIFSNVDFIPMGGLYILPFIFCTAYAIYAHNAFRIRNLAYVSLALVSCSITAFEFIFVDNNSIKLLVGFVFVITLLITIEFIRNLFQLQLANDRLRELDKQKSEFVSFATHQLRSPLTAMTGYTSLILEGDMGEINPQVKEAVERISESSKTLANVVDDYLNISRIELGTMKYSFTEVNLRDMVEQVIAELKPNIEKAGLALNFENASGDSYLVQADPDKLKQVIGNLIDNSVKYTPQGSIDVSLARTGGAIVFSVKDTGIGMSEKTIPKLFQKFTRADKANQTNIRGTGLGLYVAKEIVTAHHGRIWAESAGEGKGSQFFVELPKSA